MAMTEPHDEPGSGVSPKTLQVLERLDNLAHVVVAALFILMAATVLIYTGILFARQVPLIGNALLGKTDEAEQHPVLAVGADPFFRNSLEVLSSILFAVIILELLRTIITYLQSHDIRAIMREFLVVGIISSIRKVLLVGAESSLSSEKGAEFIKEATGTVISIVGILLLIVGLVVLQRSYNGRDRHEEPTSPAHH